jgi:hypothetical protein
MADTDPPQEPSAPCAGARSHRAIHHRQRHARRLSGPRQQRRFGAAHEAMIVSATLVRRRSRLSLLQPPIRRPVIRDRDACFNVSAETVNTLRPDFVPVSWRLP